jgi:small redox-active disulfide protein 2
MKIEILGTGCPKCKKLTENVEAALNEKGLNAEIVKVTDINKIIEYGVMTSPALVIDGKVVSAGRTLTTEEIGRLIS